MSRRAEIGLALAIAALAIAIRAPLFDLPLERDEGEYAYIAWRMGEGELPYLHAFDQKPPGIFWAYRLALSAPGDPVIAIRALGALAGALACLALFALVRGLLLAFASADPMLQGPIANTELFMLPFMLASAALLPRVWTPPHSVFRWGVAVGVLLGIATAMKQVAIVNAPLFVAMVAWQARGARVRSTAIFTAALALGGLLAWLPLLAWLAHGGALGAGLDAFVLHNLAYVGAPTPAGRWAALLYFMHPLLVTQGLVWCLALVGLALLWRRPDRFPALFLTGFAIVNALGVSVSGRYYPHYFQQLVPAVMALAGVVAARFGAHTRWLRHALPALALLPLLFSTASFWTLDADAATARIYPGSPFEAMPALAGEIAALSAPGERVFVFGSEPELLFYARRASASRYIFLFPLFGGFGDPAPRWRELESELRAAPPAVIAWMPNEMTKAGPTDWLETFVRQGYRRHALVVWDESNRGRLVRTAADGSAPGLGEGAFVWAVLWQRRDAPD